MAATFVNLERQHAFRIISTEEARDLIPLYAPEIIEKRRQQIAAYRRMPDCVLFKVRKVRIPIDPCDMPGPTRSKIACARCGQVVRDHREIMVDGRPLCRPCPRGAYFKDSQAVSWPDMNWSPGDKDSNVGPEAIPEKKTREILTPC